MPRGTRDCLAKGRRLIASIDYRGNAGRDTISCPKRTISRYGVKLGEPSRLPTGLPTRYHDVLEASHTRRASPLLAGLSTGITSSSGNPITRQGISLEPYLNMSSLDTHRRNGTPC